MKIRVFDIVGGGLKAFEAFVSDPGNKVLHIRLSPSPTEGSSDRFYVFYEPVGGDEATMAREAQLAHEKEELRRLIKLAREVRAAPYFDVYQKCKNQAQRHALLLAYHDICSSDAAIVAQLLDPAMSSVLDWEG